MFAEHSIVETAQRLTCLADSIVNFSVQGAITGCCVRWALDCGDCPAPDLPFWFYCQFLCSRSHHRIWCSPDIWNVLCWQVVCCYWWWWKEGCSSWCRLVWAPPSFRDWLSGRRAWMPWRSGPASAAGLVLHGPLVCSRRQRESLGGEFAGSLYIFANFFATSSLKKSFHKIWTI